MPSVSAKPDYTPPPGFSDNLYVQRKYGRDFVWDCNNKDPRLQPLRGLVIRYYDKLVVTGAGLYWRMIPMAIRTRLKMNVNVEEAGAWDDGKFTITRNLRPKADAITIPDATPPSLGGYGVTTVCIRETTLDAMIAAAVKIRKAIEMSKTLNAPPNIEGWKITKSEEGRMTLKRDNLNISLKKPVATITIRKHINSDEQMLQLINDLEKFLEITGR